MGEENIKLLIVDDEIHFLNAISERLRLKGFDVTSAENGEAAMDSAMKESFDVAVVDLHMPGMNGQELLKALKERHRFMQVLILTGQGTMTTAMECMRMGAATYIEKPYNFEQLVEAIREAYTSKMIKKFEHQAMELKNIEAAASGKDPVDALKALRMFDGGENKD
jgi:DNA-binding NtrC family response regulator